MLVLLWWHACQVVSRCVISLGLPEYSSLATDLAARPLNLLIYHLRSRPRCQPRRALLVPVHRPPFIFGILSPPFVVFCVRPIHLCSLAYLASRLCSGGLMKLWVVWTIVCRRELADDCWFQVSADVYDGFVCARRWNLPYQLLSKTYSGTLLYSSFLPAHIYFGNRTSVMTSVWKLFQIKNVRDM